MNEDDVVVPSTEVEVEDNTLVEFCGGITGPVVVDVLAVGMTGPTLVDAVVPVVGP